MDHGPAQGIYVLPMATIEKIRGTNCSIKPVTIKPGPSSIPSQVGIRILSFLGLIPSINRKSKRFIVKIPTSFPAKSALLLNLHSPYRLKSQHLQILVGNSHYFI